jgi:hypothetical protein
MARPMTEELGFDRKVLYSVAEVAAITGCPPGRVRRWIYRRQLDAVVIDDFMLVPFAALVARVERIEAARARRRSRQGAGTAKLPEGVPLSGG